MVGGGRPPYMLLTMSLYLGVRDACPGDKDLDTEIIVVVTFYSCYNCLV